MSETTGETLFQMGVGPDAVPDSDTGDWRGIKTTTPDQGYANGRYIAEAHNVLPTLIAEVAAFRAMTASPPDLVLYPDCTPGIRHFFLPAASECGCGALVRPLATGAEATLFQPNPRTLERLRAVRDAAEEREAAEIAFRDAASTIPVSSDDHGHQWAVARARRDAAENSFGAALERARPKS